MTNDEFFKGLSEAEWETATAIETELSGLLHEGLTEDVALKFVRTVMTVRTAFPAATVGGIFDQALDAGLGYFLDERTLAQLRGTAKPPRRKRSTLK